MKKIKIDIISGFLGAGKTTFIKKLMDGVFPGETIVILENEFGRINIDQETLKREGLTVKPIQAGCICCSSSRELPSGILEIINEYAPDRILVEPTGIAKLTEIKKLLQEEELTDLCEIDHIITITDAKNYYLRTLISKEFFEDQIRASEVIFLSKTEEMEEEKIQSVITDIYKINPRCLITAKSWNSLSPDDLLKQMELKDRMERKDQIELKDQMELKNQIELKNLIPLTKQPIRLRINHANDFESYEIVRDAYINLEQIKGLITCIEDQKYGEVHRLKGICSDSEYGFYSVEYVPGETVIKRLTDPKNNSVRSEICLIGRKLKTEELQQIF